MPATITLKECKKHVDKLPRKQRTALAESILQEDYERECLAKAEECLADIESGKEPTLPLSTAIRDLKSRLKKISANAKPARR